MKIKNFYIKKPLIINAGDIEKLSLKAVEDKCISFKRFNGFDKMQKEVVKRLIHSTTCFDRVINNIYFTDNAITSIIGHIKDSASIIVDTNMIKSGLSSYYTDKYNNEVICHVSDDDIKAEAGQKGLTRSYLAVQKALKDNYNKKVILACGNAPTFLYSAVEALLKNDWDLSKVIILAFPVGFVNVVESKEYTKDFLSYFNMDGIILEGSFGSSPLVIACLHAVYRQIA